MSLPTVVAVDPGSAAARAGLLPGDEIVAVSGHAPKDIIEYRLLVDEPDLDVDLRRGGLELSLFVAKDAGEALGAEVHSAVFDRVQTCDNHCEFCFIYQLPPGLRRSLYLKDDDYRLSFLYGNFTTLTRFTEADLERIITERLSPLYVSIHSTDPELRARMLNNRRGATSLRWLRALLDAGVEVHGQIVVCPGVNDGPALEDTLCGILDRYPELATVAAVPLGISRFGTSANLRPHTEADAVAVLETIHAWQEVYRSTLDRRLIFAADEYYLLAGMPFPPAADYEGFPQHENGVGMAAALLAGGAEAPRSGFFAAVDGAPPDGYRAPRARRGETTQGPLAILTGEYGARVLAPVVGERARLIAVRNDYFGGNIAVTGLLVGADIARELSGQPEGHRYVLPDVCLSRGQFLDGTRPEDLPRPVEVVPTTGDALRDLLRTGGAR
jgi:putative radical SAM enzyme (TIGR03279 family)